MEKSITIRFVLNSHLCNFFSDEEDNDEENELDAEEGKADENIDEDFFGYQNVDLALQSTFTILYN